jgi:C4-dicarboxylate-specific signal transduction histidine kinase
MHDVKNNVFLLDISLQNLGRKITRESVDEALELLEVSKASIDQIKRVIQSGGEEKTKVAVSALLTQVVDGYRDKSTNVYCDFQQGEKYVIAKQTDLLRIFQNIVKNAFEAMSKTFRKKIDLSVKSTGNQVEISIYNNGPHIPIKAAAPKGQTLFYVFEQGYTSKETGEGLGLHSVKNLVIANGGSIRVQNRREGGVEFTIQLPEYKERSS